MANVNNCITLQIVVPEKSCNMASSVCAFVRSAVRIMAWLRVKIYCIRARTALGSVLSRNFCLILLQCRSSPPKISTRFSSLTLFFCLCVRCSCVCTYFVGKVHMIMMLRVLFPVLHNSAICTFVYYGDRIFALCKHTNTHIESYTVYRTNI